MAIHIREAREEDKVFIEDMRYEAIFIPEHKPPKAEIFAQPAMRKYYEGWGRKGDRAMVAVSEEGEKIGAVWYRLFSDEDRGYGFIDSQTPELGIGLVTKYRGMGIGTKLMKRIIEAAKDDGFHSLSLSVDSRNTAALNLYRKTGFQIYDDSGSSWTMKLTIL